MISILMAGLFLESCYYDIEEELYPQGNLCDTVSVTYSLDVMSILETHCITCHSGGTPSGSIDLSTYGGVNERVQDGSLLCSIQHASGCSPMPQNAGQLSACNIEKISKWIAEGALNN
ncbi:MAG: hypothetical protein HKN79_10070 [Flavobacteriales bacterium]|nr:hypothetical protein [Flavobacteriales bacterium]